jgi:Arc/MetJ-type ribon-helix-helix transcriptional regulator
MRNVRTVTVEIDEHLTKVVNSALDSGAYATLDDIAEEAMYSWAHERLLQDPQYVERLRELIQEGLDSGEPIEGNFDVDDIHRRGMARLQREKAA